MQKLHLHLIAFQPGFSPEIRVTVILERFFQLSVFCSHFDHLYEGHSSFCCLGTVLF